MHGALLAVVHPDNTPHGANLTFAVPVLVFVITAAALFIRFRAAHSVPGHVALGSSRWVTSGTGSGAAFGHDAVDAAVEPHPDPEATVTSGAPDAAAAGPGTVQSGTTGPVVGDGAAADEAATGTEQPNPASEGTEESE